MITVLICILIGIAVAIYRTRKDYMKYIDGPFTYIGNSVIGVLFGLGAGIIIASPIPKKTRVVEQVYNIESLKDNGSIHGNFFLGSGQIDGRMQYVFYYEVNGLYKMGQVNTCDAEIRYTDSLPRLLEYQPEITDDWINWFALDLIDLESTYIIEVPRGTIQHNYNLDSE